MNLEIIAVLVFVAPSIGLASEADPLAFFSEGKCPGLLEEPAEVRLSVAYERLVETFRADLGDEKEFSKVARAVLESGDAFRWSGRGGRSSLAANRLESIGVAIRTGKLPGGVLVDREEVERRVHAYLTELSEKVEKAASDIDRVVVEKKNIVPRVIESVVKEPGKDIWSGARTHSEPPNFFANGEEIIYRTTEKSGSLTNDIGILDLKTGTTRKVEKVVSLGQMLRFTVSEDLKKGLGYSKSELAVVDIASGKVAHLTSGLRISSVFVGPDHHYALVRGASNDAVSEERAQIWDLWAGKLLSEEDHPAGGYLSAVDFKTGNALTASNSAKTNLFYWNFITGKTLGGIEKVEVSTPTVYQLKTNRDFSEYLLFGEVFGLYRVEKKWINAGEKIFDFEKIVPEAIAADPDLRFVVTLDKKGELVYWDALLKKKTSTLGIHKKSTRLLMSADGRFALSSSSEDFMIWDLKSGTMLYHAAGLANVGEVVASPAFDRFWVLDRTGKITEFKIDVEALEGGY